MSVPRLDTGMIEGKELLFGPLCRLFSTKFLKHGSLMDLPLSIKDQQHSSMLSAGDKIFLYKIFNRPDLR